MTAKSHVTTSLTIGIIPLFLYTNSLYYMLDYMGIYLAGVAFGSLIPDIDEENSSIGRRVPLIASFINDRFGHRKITHNLLFYIFIFMFAYYQSLYVTSYVYTFLLGFGIGGILHILEDCLTNGGVPGALKPIIRNFVLLKKNWRFNTNGKFENYIYYPIITIIFFLEFMYLNKEIIGV